MEMLWPGFLLLLGLIPLLGAVYVWILRRRRRFAVRYSSLVLVREALGQQSRWRRHLPFALFLLALTSLVVAAGRPVAVVNVPTGQTTVILAMDVSRSMCSTDIQPNRLEVAKDAARSFVERQNPAMQIGIVAFAGFAELIQAPTSNQEALRDAIERLTTGRRTAIGSAILEALDAISEVNQKVAPSGSSSASGAEPGLLPEGAYHPDIIVLLTDGASNTGPFPLEAAQQAVERGIRIYTIGFGTDMGGDMDCSRQFQGGMIFDPERESGGNQQFGGFQRGIDEYTLQEISGLTGGEYYAASSASELQDVFRNLPSSLVIKQELMEISVGFAALGALLVAMAVLLALMWHPLI